MSRAERVKIWQDAHERAPGVPIYSAWSVWIVLLALSISVLGILVGGAVAFILLLPTWAVVLKTVRPHICEIVEERRNGSRLQA